MEQIALPELTWRPKQFSVGYVEQLLIPSRKVDVLATETTKTGARRTDDCLVLSDGSRVVVTNRADVSLPANVDGVLRRRGTELIWLAHRALDRVRAALASTGLAGYSAAEAKVWVPTFSYVPKYGGAPSGLRPPQLGALFAVGAHWTLHSNPATIVMPTGTGKTETMLSVLAAHHTGPMVVVVPSKALRQQTARKFLTFGLLRKLGHIPDGVPNPVIGVLTRQPKSEADLAMFAECNVVVSVISALAGGEAKALASKIADRCGALIVDEAHHIAARTWNDFREAYAQKKVIQFTATPFRADGKLVDGELIFSYPLRRAQEDGYFKKLTFLPIHELRPDTADETMAQAACERLRVDLAARLDHLLMARCDSIQRAENVLQLYQRYGKEFHPQLIHSELKDSHARVAKLLSGQSKIAVCVNMLGEGFDLPALKIAALHDPQKSLGPLLQFTGRFTRSAGTCLGDATIIANIADPGVSTALERLYAEDSDWNVLLSEMSSQAAKDHAELVDFLNSSEPLGDQSDDDPNISHHLLRPILSTLTYACEVFSPKRFHDAVPAGTQVVKVWLNSKSCTLFFVTRSIGRVKWTRSKEIVDSEWNLFVLHFDAKRRLLYLGSSDKSSNHEGLARAVGAHSQISGEQIFRCLGHIGRLVFNNLGVTKHGRRNLSYAMYTGSDVRQALSLSEKSGSRKANLSGTGWERGVQITVGCSYKGRVWSKEAGTIPRFVEWSERVGTKLLDTTISTADVIDNVLIPDEVTSLPAGEILGLEWPVEVLRQPEDRIDLQTADARVPIYLCDIQLASVDRDANLIAFTIVSTDGQPLAEFGLKIGGSSGFAVSRLSRTPVTLVSGTLQLPLETFFSSYPPLVRFTDLAELDGNLILRPQNPYDLQLPAAALVPWQWTGIDLTKESIWKDGVTRSDSVQWAASQNFIAQGFEVVFDDDGPGEAADLVCLKEQDNCIRLALVHCKFAGGPAAGARIDDIVAVSSQAIRSAKWAGRFKELCRHLLRRGEKRGVGGRRSLLTGSMADIGRLARAARFKEVRPEVLIVQPGVSAAGVSNDQAMVLAAAASYLKQTIGIDVSIACSG